MMKKFCPVVPKLARSYAPVRSRVPQTPRPRLQKRANLADVEGVNSNAAAARAGTPQNPVQARNIPPALVNLLQEPMLFMERRLEMMNVFLGFEQANKYTLYSASGQIVGYIEEDDLSFTRAIMRQIYRLHRPFTVNVFDANGQHALTIRRPFSFINSHIKCMLPGSAANDSQAIFGESRQEWHPWRRRYNLFLNDASDNSMVQFGRVDAPFLSFQFPIANEDNQVLGAVDRNWVGLAREMFTDTGVYAIRMGPNSLVEGGYNSGNIELSLEQRAVMLATAVSIDYDYFSRHSHSSTIDV